MMDIAGSADALHPEERSGGRTERMGYQTSPHVPNIPENNICKLVEYRRAKVASFTVSGRELICLPQAFELFLKHLVGGLHTVYTKLKRLEVTPVVCNVDQVRILRGVAAIQPGVNRCKLISPHEFDVLYEDCTSSSARPGRPPKRSNFFAPDMQELSPHKQMRKSLTDTNLFQFEDLKNMNANVAAGLIPAPPGAYPSLSMPPVPFIAPYQINLMRQAAVQMALANQLQNNLARANESVPTSLPLHHMSSQQQPDISSTSITSTPAAKVTSLAPANIQYSLVERMKTEIYREEQKQLHNKCIREGTTHSPVSYCSEDVNVDADPLPTVEGRDHYSSHTNIPTPPPSSPREPLDVDTRLHSTSQPSGKACPDVKIEKSISYSQPIAHRNTDNISERRHSSSPNSKLVMPVTDDDRRNLDSMLINIKTDIQSFMESVVHHQEDIIADIEILRDRLRTQTCNQQFIEMFMREQQETKAIYQAQLEKENIHKHQINQLLQLSKTEMSNQWWNRNPSLS